MVSVAGASIGPLRRRAPSGGKSPSQRAVVSQDIHVPRGSPQQAAATCVACHFGSSSNSLGDGRRWSWCHLVGACAVLLAVALLVLQSAQPSGPITSRSRVGSSSHRSTSNLARQQHQRQQQQPQRQVAARAHHVLGEKERETADTSNSIVDKKENQWDYSSRFPRFGTPEHNKACGGREAAPRMETTTKCSVVVQPDPNGTEGLALWASNVVMGYFIHRQIANGGCNLYIDFGAGVDVEAALTTPTAPDGTAEQTSLWSVPPKGFVCRIEDNCHYIWTEPSGSTYRYSYRSSAEVNSAATTAKGRTRRNDKTKNHHLYQQQQQQLAPVPFYRFAYNPRYERLKTESFRKLGRSLMGRNGDDGSEPFNVHTGFACAFSLLFQLSPDAVRYEAKLFTQILPTLQDPDNLVIGVYIRTGATEGKTSANVGYEAIDDAEAHITAAAEILNCALKQERHFASGDKGNGGLLRRKPERIVWMLVTDSNHLKKYISKEYGGKDVVVGDDTADDPTRTRSTIPRDVITTSSAGAHTRPKGGANNNENGGGIDSQRTEAFASAVIDWWLLGESDLVISSTAYTFGNTAAMRTARPVYHKVLERNDEGSLVNNKKKKTSSTSTAMSAKAGKGTPTWPTVVKKRSHAEDPFPPLRANRVEGQENSNICSQAAALRSDGSGGASSRRTNAGNGGCWTKSTSKTARLFQPLSGNTTGGSGSSGDGGNGNGSRTTTSNSRRGFSKASSSLSSSSPPPPSSPCCSADGESLITQEPNNTIVKEEMMGLLLGGGREADCLNTGEGGGGGGGGGSACDIGNAHGGDDNDSHSAIVRPQILFRDGDNGGREECNPLGGNGGRGNDDPAVLRSPWDLPAPFMLSAFAGLDIDNGGSSTCSASAILREKQQQQQSGGGPSSSSYFSFSTNSPARKNSNSNQSSKASGVGSSDKGHSGGFCCVGMTTTPTLYCPHHALQHQAHQPLPPEQFRNHHHYHLNPIHNGGDNGGGGGGGGGACGRNDCGGRPAPPGAAISSSITSGSPSIGGGGSVPISFPGTATAAAWHCGRGGGGGPPPMHVFGGPLYQNGGVCGGGGGGGGGGVWSNAGWAPDTFDIGGLRYPLRSIPLLYSPCDVFQSGQYPPHWQNFQRRHTQHS